MKISIITLTASSVLNKGFCIRHCIQSILNQREVDFRDLEMIIVENSRHKSNEYEELLRNYISKLDTKGMSIKVVYTEKFSSRGAGRNLGVENSSGDLLVFIDEDTLIYSQDGLKYLIDAAKETDYGYGANRYWTTPEKWFEENSDTLLDDMKKGEDPFLNNISYAPENIRGSSDTRLQNVSFISNFGYCKRDAFLKVGGYPDFPGRDLEDDFLTFKLFRLNYQYKILYTTSVIHITHPFEIGEDSNISMYYEMMKKMGYFWFNISKTFEEINPDREDVLQKLDVIHPDYRIEEAYQEYLKFLPPNLNIEDETEIRIWKEHNQYCLIDYLQISRRILISKSLEKFVKVSGSDFDNIIPVILSLINCNIIEINPDGKIVDKMNFKYFPKEEYSKLKVVNNPNEEFNQFPCDVDSRLRRIELLKERYPLTDYLRIGILGDDDLLSSEIAKESWIDAKVFEVDENVIGHFNPQWKNITLKQMDFRQKDIELKSEMDAIQTFIVDPPYTKNGILLFIYKGLQLLKKDGGIFEFYAIINPTMIGSYMQDVQEVLVNSGVWVHEVLENYSQYPLPKNFKERARANDFLEKIGVNPSSLKTSSSSSLYIFRTKSPNLEELWKNIDIEKVYNHFI